MGIGNNISVNNSGVYMDPNTSIWITTGITGFCTITGALIGAWVSFKVAQQRDLSQTRRVALAVMKAFHAEITLGAQLQAGGNAFFSIPNSAWTTYKDLLLVSVVDVCLQCARGGKKIASNGQSVQGFPISEFLQHLKNYYECIVPSINNSRSLPANQQVRNTYLTATSNVEAMVGNIVTELEKLVK